MLIDVEIVSAELDIKNKCIEILAIDIGEKHLEELERNRAAEEPREIEFSISLESKRSYWYAVHFLNESLAVKKAAKELQTRISWQQALQAIVGTVTMLSSKYIVAYNN